MQMVKRVIGGFFLLIVLLWLLSPKEELYYLLEKELKKSDIIISNEIVKDRWFGVEILNADIYVKGAKMAKLAELKLNILFLYNSLSIKGIDTNSAFHKDVPKNIEEIKSTYSILDPLKIKLDGLGSFGVLDGEVNLIDRDIIIGFPVVKDINPFKKFIKRDETGEWKYETNY